jgi:hypothetical protein
MARFLQEVPAGSQNKKGFLKISIFISVYSISSQIWLNPHAADGQFG